jgi:hypothetical protein
MMVVEDHDVPGEIALHVAWALSMRIAGLTHRDEQPVHERVALYGG